MTDAQLLLLADAVLVVHFCIAAYITFSLPVIWIGRLCGWGFVRNPWFRFSHAAAMGFVLMESFIGMFCPLTTWEANLRSAAGGGGVGEGESFVAYWMGQILFHDFSETAYTIVYALYFLAIIITFLLVPVRRKIG